VGSFATIVGSKTKVVDAGRDYLMPGFFDPHGYAQLHHLLGLTTRVT
jgi:predicted amidohydrolase YtcJ